MSKNLGVKTMNLSGEERTIKIIFDISLDGTVSAELWRAEIWKDGSSIDKVVKKMPINRQHSELITMSKFSALMSDLQKICDDIALEELNKPAEE